MPAAAPISGLKLKKLLAKLGGQIRARRKELGVSASVAAESAAMSRQTLHRIEKGETSVTMGAYLGLLSALGLEFEYSWQTPIYLIRTTQSVEQFAK